MWVLGRQSSLGYAQRVLYPGLSASCSSRPSPCAAGELAEFSTPLLFDLASACPQWWGCLPLSWPCTSLQPLPLLIGPAPHPQPHHLCSVSLGPRIAGPALPLKVALLGLAPHVR